MKKYEVYESNAGNLTLVVYGETGPEYIHTGYEFCEGHLKQDLAAIRDGSDPLGWDGNEIEEIVGSFGALVADNDGVYLDHAGISATAELGEVE